MLETEPVRGFLRRKEVIFMSETDFKISKNLSEDLIDIYLNDCLKNSGICTCDRCRADVRAYALNNMPAHYVVTELGDAFVRVDAMSVQSQADIVTAITLGINRVKEHPRHVIDK